MRHWPILFAWLVGVLAVVGTPATAFAVDINVTTTADELAANGACSLREAIRNMTAGFQQHPDCGAASHVAPGRQRRYGARRPGVPRPRRSVPGERLARSLKPR